MSVRVWLIGRGLFRETLRALLRQAQGVTVVGEGTDWAALPATPLEPPLDAVIADGDLLAWPHARAVLHPCTYVLVSLRYNRLVMYRPQPLQATPHGLAQALGLQEQHL